MENDARFALWALGAESDAAETAVCHFVVLSSLIRYNAQTWAIHPKRHLGAAIHRRSSESRGKRLERDIGPVGHDAVAAEVDEAAHVGRVVHGPDVDLDAGIVRGGDEPGV